MYVCLIADPDGDQMNLAFVQYIFTGPPHLILQKPHGNSKSSAPYTRTSPSTLQKLKECAKSQAPKEAVQSEKGGTVKGAAGDIPRNRKQVSNICSQAKDTDPLLSVMVMCKDKLGEKLQSICSSCYICSWANVNFEHKWPTQRCCMFLHFFWGMLSSLCWSHLWLRRL